MQNIVPALIPAPKVYTENGTDFTAAVLELSVSAEFLAQGRALREEIRSFFGETVLSPGSYTEEFEYFKTADQESKELLGANFRSASVAFVPLRLVYTEADASIPDTQLYSGFTLDSSPSGIVLQAASCEAAAAASACLLQLLHMGWNGWRFSLPSCSISDCASLQWRGLMIDSARHFLPVENLKKILRCAWLYRINRLHWHLSDDQGWRIELLNLPETVGSGSTRPGADPNRNGFYTQKDIREVVAYARDRGICIVPELDLPGHVQAVLAGYPHLACSKGPHAVRTAWGISEDVLCMGNEASFEFACKAWDEVCALFPGPYVHIGGDECPTVRWETCPRCSQKKKELGLESWVDLHGHFIARISDYLKQKGKTVFGWDEVMDSSLPNASNVVHWRQWLPGLGRKALDSGRDLVRSPYSPYYLDFVQTEDRTRSPGLAYRAPQASSLRRVYEFDPLEGFEPEDLQDRKGRGRFMGIQVNAWSEYMRDPRRFEYMIFPRLLAFAETAWNCRDRLPYARWYAHLDTAHCSGNRAILTRCGINFCPLESAE